MTHKSWLELVEIAALNVARGKRLSKRRGGHAPEEINMKVIKYLLTFFPLDADTLNIELGWLDLD